MGEARPTEVTGLKSGLRKESRKLGLDFDKLKSGGFIKQTQKDLFTVRLRCPGGKVTADKLRVAADIAERYGRGETHISVRQSIEVPYVSYVHFDEVNRALAGVGWSVASCGPRIRVPVACGGCSYNPNGLMDTQSACAEVDRRYFGTATGHHKFKITFAGCPIDCVHSRSADLGFQGVLEPEFNPDLCNACGLCVKSCQEKALAIIDGLIVRDAALCNYCGDCVKVCPLDALTGKRSGWLARVGGKHGKHPYQSWEIANFLDNDEVYALIEATIKWYQASAQGRERIGVTIERLGLDRYVDEAVLPLGLELIRNPEDRLKFYTRGNTYAR